MTSVGIVGLGNLGTAIGNLVAGNGFAALGWEYHTAVVQEVNETKRNSRFLPGVILHERLTATSDLAEMLSASDVIFITIPSVFVKPTLEPLRDRLRDDAVLVNMAKGIDRETGLTSLQVLAQLFPHHRRVMFSGPTIANEFARGMPTVAVLAGRSRSDQLLVAHLLDNETFRTRFSDDEIGVELGGVLKNIYAIGLGLFDGKGISSINFRAVYLTAALEEMAKMGERMGAQIETFLYLSGIGDLLATSLSDHSHNRHMGELLAQGLTREQIREQMGVLPEGYNTLEVILYIAEKLHVSIPLAHGLWDVINGRQTADSFISSFIRDFVE